MNGHRYILQPYEGPASRVRCPQCGKPREFSCYLDTETGELLPDHVGRCNREENCGYHFTPAQYFESIRPIGGQAPKYTPPTRSAAPKQSVPVRVDTLPLELVNQSLNGYKRNNLVIWLRSLFGEAVMKDLIQRYFIGTSKHWDGANVFWQINTSEEVRQAKVMLYNPATGRRVKSEILASKWDDKARAYRDDKDNGDKIFFAGKSLLNDYEANLMQCFFGEHLLAEHPGARVAIVESEKTAIIGSVYFPRVWLATGGKNGARWTDKTVCKVLQGRDIILFPDLNAYEVWKAKAQEIHQAIPCRISVSSVLEKIATHQQRQAGWDLADYLLKTDGDTGFPNRA